MKISTQQHSSILHLQGAFDTFQCSAFLEEVDKLVDNGVRNLVLNLRLVKFINSTALGSIIRAHKTLKAKGGKVVVSRPSAFCRTIMDSMGLHRVVPIFDTDEAAMLFVTTNQPIPEVEEDRVFEEDKSAVLFSPVDKARTEQFIPESSRTSKANPVHRHTFGQNWRGIGQLTMLDTHGVKFTWNGGRTGLSGADMARMLAAGTELNIKFRLPLLQKGHQEAVVTVAEVVKDDEGVSLVTAFRNLDATTKKAVAQYAEDIAFLKSELRDATDEEGAMSSEA